MLYQFTDRLAASSIDLAMQKRRILTEARTIFVCNYPTRVYKNLKDSGYDPQYDRYIELLPTDLLFTGDYFTIERFEETIHFFRKVEHDTYVDYFTDTCEYKCHLSEGYIFQIDKKWCDGYSVSYYEHTLIKQEVYTKKEVYILKHVSIHNEDGSVAYYQFPDGSYLIHNHKIAKKVDFYRYIIEQIPIEKDDFITIDRVHPYVHLLFPHISKGTVILPTYGEFIISSSFKRNKALIQHDLIHRMSKEYLEKLMETQKYDHCLFNPWYSVLDLYPEMLDLIVTETELEKLELERHMTKYLPKIPVVACPPKWIECVENRGTGHTVCAVLRLSSEKKPKWLVQVIEKAHKLLPTITLDIYGGGPMQEEMEAYVKEHNLDCVRFKGWTKDKQVSRNYQVFLSTSLSEGFCQSMFEAVVCGCAVVATDTDYGHRTHVHQNGILVDVEDKSEEEILDGLACALVKVLVNPEQFKKHSHDLVMKYNEEYFTTIWQNIFNHHYSKIKY